MEEMLMADLIQVRRDSSTNWVSANPLLAQGEPGFETDTKKLKIGDGIVNWNSLSYLNDASINVATLFDGLSSSSYTYDGSNRITQIIYTTGNKQTFTYTGETEIVTKYYFTDGTTLLATYTINFDANGNVTSAVWS